MTNAEHSICLSWSTSVIMQGMQNMVNIGDMVTYRTISRADYRVHHPPQPDDSSIRITSLVILQYTFNR